MTPRISCCMIVRDEESTLRACLQSVRPHVDELVVLDTGSRDNTASIAREFADVFETYDWSEDFAAARQRSFDLATNDWVCWFDGDDVVLGAECMRELAAQADPRRLHNVMAHYEYLHAPDGSCTLLQERERLMYPRHRFRWTSPVHEVCLPQDTTDMVYRFEPRLRVIHQRQHSAKPPDPTRNLRILQRHVQRSGEGDVRALYYLACEELVVGLTGSAMRHFRRYIQLSGWSDERCLAMLQLAKLYASLGDSDQALHWATQALLTKSWSEPMWQLGYLFFGLALEGVDPVYNYRRAAAWLGNGLRAETKTVLQSDPTEPARVHECLSVALARLGMLDDARASIQAGLQVQRTALLEANERSLQTLLGQRRIAEGSSMLLTAGAIAPKTDALLRNIAQGGITVQISPGVPALGVPPAAPVEALGENYSPGPEESGLGNDPVRAGLRLAFFAGKYAVPPWDPETVRLAGAGGSETMLVEITRRLASRGHDVTVFADRADAAPARFEGVLWRDESELAGSQCDVLVVSRWPRAVDMQCRATARVLWVHDVHCGPELTYARNLRFDRIVVLSEWHRQFFAEAYPFFDHTRLEIIRNGIDRARFRARGITRVPGRAIYASSHDRGLESALRAWPDVRAQVPGAELHVFYGRELLEPALAALLDRLTSVGVVYHGRVNQQQLADEFLRATLWCYPTWFAETSCLTAMEATAAGCRVVTSPVGALPETLASLRNTSLLSWVRDAWLSADYQRELTRLTVEHLRAHTADGPAEHRSVGELDTLASEWESMLGELASTVERAVVPRFFCPQIAGAP